MFEDVFPFDDAFLRASEVPCSSEPEPHWELILLCLIHGWGVLFLQGLGNSVVPSTTLVVLHSKVGVCFCGGPEGPIAPLAVAN